MTPAPAAAALPTTAAISTAGLEYKAGGRAILEDISLAINEGESVVVVGPNGAGKTTLLRLLNRVLIPTRGRVELFGSPLTSLAQKDIARRVGYVPQSWTPPGGFSVEEFVALGRYPHLRFGGRPSPDDRARVELAIATAGVGELASRDVSRLSGGELQSVLIAAALAQEPSVLLIDEPTAHLDYGHQAEVIALLARLHSECGLTLVTVTHDLTEALQLGGRWLGLHGGRLVYDGSGEDGVASGAVANLFGVEFDTVPHPSSGATLVVPRKFPSLERNDAAEDSTC